MVIEFLKFASSGFWEFCTTAFFFCVASGVIVAIADAIRRK